ncbi:MAG: biotin--acetyl-CoA-carboxylase ligase [Marmoricola sp.]|nr:biotin--acetyl-CoA-carboxylase ligase [Marmoricola sp.]
MNLLPTATSTNAVAAADPVAGTLVVADHQTAGRGRLDRSWETPPGTALTFSAVVDPGLADADWPLLPLGVALGVADAISGLTQLKVAVKWPNDLLLAGAEGDQRKVCGILLERVTGPAGTPLAVIGIGINVGTAAEDLPVPTATSLAIGGAVCDRTALLGAVAHSLEAVLGSLRRNPLEVLERYRRDCDTVGRDVTVQLPGGDVLTGRATGLDRNGRLIVSDRAIGAGDVVHVRPT